MVDISLKTDPDAKQQNHQNDQHDVEKKSSSKSSCSCCHDNRDINNYDNNTDGHLPLHWLQPKEQQKSQNDANESLSGVKVQNQTTLPSFRDLQQKTHRTLYGTDTIQTMSGRPRDKSPKGSVDTPIQHLVHLINCHSRLCTLSSCSGRLSLFDPNGSSDDNDRSSSNNEDNNIHNNDNNDNNENSISATTANTKSTETSGKGRGGWILVSHEKLCPEALVNAISMKTTSITSRVQTTSDDDDGDDIDHDDDVLTKDEYDSNDNADFGNGNGNYNGSGSSIDDNNDCEERQQQKPWTFRFEPLLLHVAAASLNDGQKLLTIALNLGFRESGLVVTDKRVTVAIRTNSLSTATPLFPTAVGNRSKTSSSSSSLSSFYVPSSFLRALVHDANIRLESNWKLLDRLYRSIESMLFEIRSFPPPITVIHSAINSIPTLNLWNAGAIVTTAATTIGATIANSTTCTSDSTTTIARATKQQVWIVGGYGCGPTSTITSRTTQNNTITTAAKRSSKLYKLERELLSHGGRGLWQEQWKVYERPSNIHFTAINNNNNTNNNIECNYEDLTTNSNNSFLYLPTVLNDTKICTRRRTRLGIRWLQGDKTFPDIQGMTSCRLVESGLVLFWGGRKGPTLPASAETLYVFDSDNNADDGSKENNNDTVARLGTVIGVRGNLPRSRWGHGLVPISGNRAVLMGGCNMEDGALDDVFVLHLCTEDQQQQPLAVNDCCNNHHSDAHAYFFWERLSIRLPTSRFHFGTALLKKDTILLVGGLQSTQQLLQPFEHDTVELAARICDKTVWACYFENSRKNDKKNPVSFPRTRATVVSIDLFGGPSLYSDINLFGTACCTILSKNLLFITGGIQLGKTGTTSPPLQAYWISNNGSSSKISRLRLQRIALGYNDNTNNRRQIDHDPLKKNEGSMKMQIDFGSLVHHCCINISDDEFILVGGGAPSFAFGECYARSHHILIDTNNLSAKNDHNTRNSHSNLSVRSLNRIIPDSKKLGCQSVAPNAFKNDVNMTNVFYVTPRLARQAKNLLHQKGWLDKRYRMIKTMTEVEIPKNKDGEGSIGIPSTSQHVIAVPISVPFTKALTICDEWILGHGRKEMPFSTSQYASKAKY